MFSVESLREEARRVIWRRCPSREGRECSERNSSAPSSPFTPALNFRYNPSTDRILSPCQPGMTHNTHSSHQMVLFSDVIKMDQNTTHFTEISQANSKIISGQLKGQAVLWSKVDIMSPNCLCTRFTTDSWSVLFFFFPRKASFLWMKPDRSFLPHGWPSGIATSSEDVNDTGNTWWSTFCWCSPSRTQQLLTRMNDGSGCHLKNVDLV